MSDTDDLFALQQAAQSVQDMRDALSQRRKGVAADVEISLTASPPQRCGRRASTG